MKVPLPSFILFLLLPLSITAAGSVRITIVQNGQYLNEETPTVWGSLAMEDIEILALYNDTRTIEFKQSWSRANMTSFYWQFLDMVLNRYIFNIRSLVGKFYKKLGIKGSFLIQGWTRCSSSMEDIGCFTYRVAADGEDLVTLNITGVWVAGNAPYSQGVQRLLQKDKDTTETIKSILTKYCPSLATLYLTAGKEAYSRKIQPQVYITKKPYESETDVICMVTGFYPKPINVSLWKENKEEDVMSTVTLPNGDGTYQITIVTTVNDIKNVYCRVEHSSLKEPLIVHLALPPWISERSFPTRPHWVASRVSSLHRNQHHQNPATAIQSLFDAQSVRPGVFKHSDKVHHTLIGLVVGITGAVVCVVGLACFVTYKKRRRYTSIHGMAMN
ncbi:antigen-presenting glycoprotein CD1d-like isoform X2 [Aquarana catesbeiana]|uniref:antigen-presenting glycoprotein CD1d-like isoform X2 n=1 Tax=Aquarana catesbeiana TaxID=8400 RepID=UPI003CC93EF5